MSSAAGEWTADRSAMVVLQVDCCSLGVGKDSIVFADDCSPQDVLMPNHTAAALAAAAGAA